MATAIEVDHLTKSFPGKLAVDNISFSIEQGQVVGFLGPNGAGKTTTIRMLTCFSPATSGRASVMGYDVFEQSIEVRKRIGYLPEATPVYPEMRVEEYLRYRARLKGVTRGQTEAAVGRAMERTRISDVRRRIIGQLSKGYRQRVGLADALVASPPILILDEPTIGLDPNQIRQTRDLIRELGEDHTVFLSTHILPEVEQVCDRVVIIHRGHISGEGTPTELRERVSQGVRLRLEARGQIAAVIQKDLEEIDGVTKVTLLRTEQHAGETYREGGGQDDVSSFAILAQNDVGIREDIFYAAVDGEWVIRELATEAMSLEEIFASITSEESAEDEEEGEERGEEDEERGEEEDEDRGEEDEDRGEEDDDRDDDERREA